MQQQQQQQQQMLWGRTNSDMSMSSQGSSSLTSGGRRSGATSTGSQRGRRPKASSQEVAMMTARTTFADDAIGLVIPAPYSPENVLHWQFGDAPVAISPRKEMAMDIKPPPLYSLDNHFFDGPLDWDLPRNCSNNNDNLFLLGLPPLPINTSLSTTTTPTMTTAMNNNSNNNSNNGCGNFITAPQLDNNFVSAFDENDPDELAYIPPMSSTGVPLADRPTGANHKKRWASFGGVPNEVSPIATGVSEKKKKHMRSVSASSAMMLDIPSMLAAPLEETPVIIPQPKTRSLIRSSGYRGVSRCSKDGRWQARIRIGQSVRYLGRFVTEEEAAQCYDDAAREFHGERAVLNFRRPGEEHLAVSKKASAMAGLHALPLFGSI